MVINLTELGRFLPRRDLAGITHILIHRIENGTNAREVAQFFRENPEWTGGGMGYHFIIKKDGDIEQACALDRKAPGARAANRIAVQIALIGDLLHDKATVAQEAALLDVLVDLSEWIGFDKVQIMGHTDFPGGSADLKKVCPGPGLNLKHIIELSKEWAQCLSKQHVLESLASAGYVLEQKG